LVTIVRAAVPTTWPPRPLALDFEPCGTGYARLGLAHQQTWANRVAPRHLELIGLPAPGIAGALLMLEGC
jgi:hypothetical protein